MKALHTILLTAILFIGCKNNNESIEKNGPDIYIISPLQQDTATYGSTVAISAIVADLNEVHDVRIQITNNHSTSPFKTEFFFDHIHNTIFNIDTSFVADASVDTSINYIIEILANDMSGNLNSESVSINIKN